MIGKLIVVFGGLMFAVCIYLYSDNSQRAGLAARNYGTHSGGTVEEWSLGADRYLVFAVLGLAVAGVGIFLDRTK